MNKPIDSSQAEPLAGADARTFEYLLNRVERTGCSTAPADAGYGEARKAVFAYVATEREARRKAEAKLAALQCDLREIENALRGDFWCRYVDHVQEFCDCRKIAIAIRAMLGGGK